MTFKNDIGRTDVGTSGTYSCLFNGVYHGQFKFQQIKKSEDGSSYIRYGSYDVSKDGYCNDYDSKYSRCINGFSE